MVLSREGSRELWARCACEPKEPWSLVLLQSPASKFQCSPELQGWRMRLTTWSGGDKVMLAWCGGRVLQLSASPGLASESVSELRSPGWALAPLPRPSFFTAHTCPQFLVHFAQENAPKTRERVNPSVPILYIPLLVPPCTRLHAPLIRGLSCRLWAVWSWHL